MTSDRLLDRVRAANPVPAASIADAELFARIVAGPGDPRLGATARRRRRRLGTRGLVVIAAAIVLTAGGGAFGAVQLGAFSHAGPKALFEANPAGRFGRAAGRVWSGTGQAVIPRSVQRAATFTVPGVGRFEYWIAISKPNGWLCTAIRQPDRSWADLDPTPADKYEIGGPMPGCGQLGWQDPHGFDYYPTYVSAPHHRLWRLVYGYVPTTGHPVAVRDRISGVTAPLGARRYFAIVVPYCQGRGCHRPAPFAWFQLQTLDAAGHVLVTDDRDPGM